jgi:solute carrier family 7 (L-type amino acid transporter), member 9/15
MEAFRKKSKFWGPVPAFVCAWVYVIILRPAEVAIITLTFAEYTIQPFHEALGLSQFCESQKNLIIKIFAIITLGKYTTF